MRSCRAFLLTTVLAFQAFGVFADNTVSPPNPLGEQLWHAHLLASLFPLAILICALVVALIMAKTAGNRGPGVSDASGDNGQLLLDFDDPKVGPCPKKFENVQRVQIFSQANRVPAPA